MCVALHLLYMITLLYWGKRDQQKQIITDTVNQNILYNVAAGLLFALMFVELAVGKQN